MPDSVTHQPDTERRSPGSFTHYRDGPDHSITCWNPEHDSCGVIRVPAADAEREIAALEAQGYINRTASCEYWSYTARAWLQGSGRQRIVDEAHPVVEAEANGVRPAEACPSGLPIFCTEPLTAAERNGLQMLVDQHEKHVALLKLALLAGTVAGALGVLRVGVSLGQVEEAMALKLGSNR